MLKGLVPYRIADQPIIDGRLATTVASMIGRQNTPNKLPKRKKKQHQYKRETEARGRGVTTHISCRKTGDRLTKVAISLEHHTKHVNYVNVSMPPGALDLVCKNVEWLTPVAMVAKVQAAYPDVTAAQIHTAWMQMSQQYWRQDDIQLPSAAKLLGEFGDDVDIFNPQGVPDGVEILCWGMKKIAKPLKGHCIEVGLDATLSWPSMTTWDSHCHIVFCLLQPAINQGKQTKALTAWTKCLKEKYDVNPTFVHVDKDMAEIGMVKVVWNAKISLCWWHLRWAVHTRLANGKLSTTPYNVARGHAEFLFIDPIFKPKGRADKSRYSGGEHADTESVQDPPTTASQIPITLQAHNPVIAASTASTMTPSVVARTALTNSLNTLSICLPRQRILRVQPAALTAPTQAGKENQIDLSALVKTTTGKKRRLTIRLLGPRKEQPKESHTGITVEAGKETESDEESDTSEPANYPCGKKGLNKSGRSWRKHL
ncbi:hypothetical protein B0H34DRAFT_844796 [Crassisporium funariophilum]|nr:hypothetical protein B0H34DRAFT_844796 [Crassisporium funariophilum]